MSRGSVRELRLVLTVDDFDGAVGLFRDALAMPAVPAVSSRDGRVAILEAGRATLELADAAHAEYIDAVEVGRRTAGPVRVALGVDDVDASAQRVADTGRGTIAPPAPTPFASRSARFEGVGEIQVTLFGTAAAALDDPGGDPPPGSVANARDLREAVALANDNAASGQLPFGALVVRDGVVLATGVNTEMADHDPTAHAEVAAVRNACRALGVSRLTGVTLVSSCEPCALCHLAAALAGIDRILYAAPKESVPDLGRPRAPADDELLVRAQQWLRSADADRVVHVPTAGADAPFRRFLAGRDRS